MLNNFNSVNSSALTLEAYMEMVYRWQHLFQGEELCQMILHIYFSDKTVKNSNPYVVLKACKDCKKIVDNSITQII